MVVSRLGVKMPLLQRTAEKGTKKGCPEMKLGEAEREGTTKLGVRGSSAEGGRETVSQDSPQAGDMQDPQQGNCLVSWLQPHLGCESHCIYSLE